MMKSPDGGSAKIYQFPVRGRFAVNGHREEARPVAEFDSPQVINAAVGSGWYHEEAIREAERARKN